MVMPAGQSSSGMYYRINTSYTSTGFSWSNTVLEIFGRSSPSGTIHGSVRKVYWACSVLSSQHCVKNSEKRWKKTVKTVKNSENIAPIEHYACAVVRKWYIYQCLV